MKNSFIFDPALSTEELRSFSRTVAEIEWLTVILVLLYQVVFSPAPKSTAAIAIGTVGFAGFVLSFHYFNFYRKESSWKLAIETWVMLVFITWVLLKVARGKFSEIHPLMWAVSIAFVVYFANTYIQSIVH